jgi:hypothetical protein
MLGAGDRVAGDEMDAFGHMRGNVAHDRPLGGADIGQDRALFQMRADLLGDRAAGADGDRQDDEIRALRPPSAASVS